MHQLGLAAGQLALRRLKRRLGGFHLRLGRQVFALRIVDFLLRDQAGLGYPTRVFRRVYCKVSDFVLGFHAVQLMLGVRHLFGHVVDGRFVLLATAPAAPEFPGPPSIVPGCTRVP